MYLLHSEGGVFKVLATLVQEPSFWSGALKNSWHSVSHWNARKHPVVLLSLESATRFFIC